MSKYIPGLIILGVLLLIYFQQNGLEKDIVLLLSVLLIIVDTHLHAIRQQLDND